jgi:hypothetical protein
LTAGSAGSIIISVPKQNHKKQMADGSKGEKED